MTGDLADAYAQDAVVEQPFMPAGSRRLEGREALRAHFARAAAMPLELSVTNLVVYETTDPEVVVVEYDYDGVVTSTGHAFTVANVQVFRVRDGQIAWSRDYHDHAAIGSALRAVR
jgi:ketosteroid isomerase-like protein